tara:strand:+ start:261 stop:641 length:381 start_codon:yes stop_codon:yes gene_type:complete
MGVVLGISLAVSIGSIVSMVSIGAAAEVAECAKMQKKANDVIDNYKNVFASLTIYMKDINSNAEKITEYLGELSDEMESLQKEYKNSVESKNEVFINIQLFGSVIILIIIVYLIYRYINSGKIIIE